MILDLCSGTGAWSQPYKQAGFSVLLVDIQDGGLDVRTLHKPKGNVYGILVAPPCTVFASSGARWERTDEDYREALSVVDACLRLVLACNPVFWALENPVGKLVRWLGPPAMYFQPYEYGDPYTKKTAIWGRFNRPEKSVVVPVEGSRMHLRYGGRSRKTKTERSKTPGGFARAFFRANNAGPGSATNAKGT